MSVHVLRKGDFYERHKTFDNTWNSLLAAKERAIERIRTCSDPVPDLSLPIHYTIEATANYHMPIITAWEGKPSIINPALAGATKRKSDLFDATSLSYHDLTGVWCESFPISREIHELRVLIAAREHFDKLATQAGNRINNIITRFEFTLGRSGSITKNLDIRAIIENLISDNPHEYDNLCPIPLSKSVKEVIKVEYEIYDINEHRTSEYFYLIKQKVYAIDWQIPSGTIPGEEVVQILCLTPGIGEITSFKCFAFVATPCRFPSAKALNAYSSLDPSFRVSAGKVTSTKKRGWCRILHTALVRSVLIALSVLIPKGSVAGAICLLEAVTVGVKQRMLVVPASIFNLLRFRICTASFDNGLCNLPARMKFLIFALIFVSLFQKLLKRQEKLTTKTKTTDINK